MTLSYKAKVTQTNIYDSTDIWGTTFRKENKVKSYVVKGENLNINEFFSDIAKEVLADMSDWKITYYKDGFLVETTAMTFNGEPIDYETTVEIIEQGGLITEYDYYIICKHGEISKNDRLQLTTMLTTFNIDETEYSKLCNEMTRG